MTGRVTVGLFFLLLVWGNLVAGMKAGLGCPDWPLCHGRVVPPYRWDIYMEFGHRVIAATATAALAVLSYARSREYRGWAKAVPMLAMGLVAAEIVMGGLVVILELPVQLTTFHFMAGLMVFLLVLYMAAVHDMGEGRACHAREGAGVYLGVAAFVFTQAALGAYVRHSGAGLACPDFPLCMGSIVPALLDKLTVAQLSHRMFAYIIFLTALALYAFTKLVPGQAHNRGLALSLVLLTFLQIAVGGVVVLSGLFYPATALHLAVAVTMLSIAVMMWLRPSLAREGAQS
ncbi:MAG TPA: COX15/CtaA family protein [Nitrospirota bacterium]